MCAEVELNRTSVGYAAPSEAPATFGATTWLNFNALERKSDFKRPFSSFHTGWVDLRNSGRIYCEAC